jgi:hypothetical protein
MNSWIDDGIALSIVPTRSQLGIVSHAGGPDGAVKALNTRAPASPRGLRPPSPADRWRTLSGSRSASHTAAHRRSRSGERHEVEHGVRRPRSQHRTGLVREVVAHSGGPRGSLGRYFPGGKTQLMGEAIDVALAGLYDELERTLTEVQTFPEAIGLILAAKCASPSAPPRRQPHIPAARVIWCPGCPRGSPARGVRMERVSFRPLPCSVREPSLPMNG